MYPVVGGILLKILKTVAVSMHGFHLLVRVSFNYKNKVQSKKFQEIDCSSRVVEAVTRLVVNLCTNTDVEDSLKRNFVNPNEEGILLSENLQFLQKSIDFNKMRKKENKKEEIEKKMELKKCGCRSGKIIEMPKIQLVPRFS